MVAGGDELDLVGRRIDRPGGLFSGAHQIKRGLTAWCAPFALDGLAIGAELTLVAAIKLVDGVLNRRAGKRYGVNLERMWTFVDAIGDRLIAAVRGFRDLEDAPQRRGEGDRSLPGAR